MAEEQQVGEGRRDETLWVSSWNINAPLAHIEADDQDRNRSQGRLAECRTNLATQYGFARLLKLSRPSNRPANVRSTPVWTEEPSGQSARLNDIDNRLSLPRPKSGSAALLCREKEEGRANDEGGQANSARQYKPSTSMTRPPRTARLPVPILANPTREKMLRGSVATHSVKRGQESADDSPIRRVRHHQTSPAFPLTRIKALQKSTGDRSGCRCRCCGRQWGD